MNGLIFVASWIIDSVFDDLTVLRFSDQAKLTAAFELGARTQVKSRRSGHRSNENSAAPRCRNCKARSLPWWQAHTVYKEGDQEATQMPKPVKAGRVSTIRCRPAKCARFHMGDYRETKRPHLDWQLTSKALGGAVPHRIYSAIVHAVRKRRRSSELEFRGACTGLGQGTYNVV